MLRETMSAWWLAARPKTLTAAAVPVLVGVGVAYAGQGVDWMPALIALFASFAIQVGTNFANDLFDYLKGADTEERVGPTRAVQAGLLSVQAMKVGTAVAFSIAFLFGLYLSYEGGWPIFVVGLLSIASGLAYTGGPYPLAYHGLGDVFVALFFGFVAVAGTVWVQHQTLPDVVWIAAIPVASLSTAILVVNNLRDEEQDAKANKRTLVVRFGRRFGLWEYSICIGLAYGTALAYAFYGRPWALLPCLSLPLAIDVVRKVRRDRGAALNSSLANTARLLFVFGVLWAVGLSQG